MLKIRLSMGGVRKRPVYKIVVADSRAPRDGRFVEKIGLFNPLLPKDKKERIKVEAERVKYWISKGAQPTLRVSRLLGELQIMPMPKPGNNPQKAIPKKDRKKSAEENKEAPKTDGKKEAPKAEAKKGEPKAEAKKGEPKAEAKKEEPKAEAKKEEPKAEAKKEEPKAEAKKEEQKGEAKKEKTRDKK